MSKKSLSTAVGEAIVHIAKLQNRVKELELLNKEGFLELEEKEARINHLTHMYSNAVYDLEQAEKLLPQIRQAVFDEGYEEGFSAGMENS